MNETKMVVSYKAAVMRRVNDIKRLTHELHAIIVQQMTTQRDSNHSSFTGDRSSMATQRDSNTGHTSINNHSSFTDDTSCLSDAKAAAGAETLVSDIDNAALPLCVSQLKASVDKCDIVKSYNLVESCRDAETDAAAAAAADDDDDDLSYGCKTASHITHSYNVNHSSMSSARPDCTLATDAASAAVSVKKSVRICDNSPTVRYIDDLRHNEVCTDDFKDIVKVISFT